MLCLVLGEWILEGVDLCKFEIKVCEKLGCLN